MDITIHMTDGESVTITPKNPSATLSRLEMLMERQNGTYTVDCGAGAKPERITIAGAHIVRLGHPAINTRI